ncbi:MAG: DUF898 family protein [Rhodoplanes sp.]|uniref:DUF898 family protein n=1 Tax=Rhodoplanes sp. TaxID=1968906 RepID=UPI0018225282|nr:DUF898 family protein [Rhodoplanes sp.]NVO14900.1 DUF898 family protein [Rhodoplanes sp.]
MDTVTLVRDPETTATAPATPAAEAVPLTFTGVRGDFFSLVLAGGLLQLVTVGFYRFWLVTDIRRHLWRNTRLGPDTLEYTGTARELLVGFLTALAVLAPLYVLYFLAGIAAEEAEAFASVPLLLVLYVFGHYAAFRARRYRLSRTALRGLRFWMTGSGFAYAGRAAIWDLATVLTLGLAYPWRAAALERYRMRRTHFGDLAGDFVGTGGRLFLRGIWMWLVVMVAIGASGAALVGLQSERVLGELSTEAVAGLSALAVMLALLLLVPLWPLFRATELRWRLEGVRFGPVSLHSTLRRRTVLGCYAAALGISSLIGSAGGVLFGTAAVVMKDQFEGLGTGTAPGQLAAITVTAVIYLLVLVGFGIIKRVFVDRGVWAAVVQSTTVVGASALDHVKAAGAAAGSLGEGLADALDVGAV